MIVYSIYYFNYWQYRGAMQTTLVWSHRKISLFSLSSALQTFHHLWPTVKAYLSRVASWKDRPPDTSCLPLSPTWPLLPPSEREELESVDIGVIETMGAWWLSSCDAPAVYSRISQCSVSKTVGTAWLRLGLLNKESQVQTWHGQVLGFFHKKKKTLPTPQCWMLVPTVATDLLANTPLLNVVALSGPHPTQNPPCSAEC